MKHYEQPIMRIVSLSMQDVLNVSFGQYPEYEDDIFGNGGGTNNV